MSGEASSGGYLTFGELNPGDTFIAFPTDGDNSGHGGYRRPHYIFVKVTLIGHDNAVKIKTGVPSCMPDSMRVIKVE